MNTLNIPRLVAKATASAVMALAFAWAAPLHAQGPSHPTANTWTAEGTQIKNTATATYTDARNNTYGQVSSNEVTVVVGFKGSIAVTSNQASATNVTQGSTGNTVSFSLVNYGNGLDTLKFGTFGNTNSSTFTVDSLCVSGTCYASIGALNAANLTLPARDTLVVTVKFDVAGGSGGATGTFTLAASSKRDSSDTGDSDTSDLNVPLTGSVAVTGGSDSVVPTNYDGSARLYYIAQFTVANNQSGDVTYNIAAAFAGTPDSDIEIKHLTNCSNNTDISTVAVSYNSSANVCVQYNVLATATAGDAATIRLVASAGSAADSANFAVTVVKASITLLKEAFLDAAANDTVTASITPKPGDTIYYKITVQNTGGAQADSVDIEDVLPTEVTYVEATDPLSAGWDFGATSGNTVKAKLTALPASGSKYFMIKVTIK